MKIHFLRTIADERGLALKRLHPFTIDADGRHREALRAYIEASITYKEVRGARIAFVYLLAAIGFLIWFAWAWPNDLPEGLATVAWYFWLAAMVGVLLAALFEWITYRNLLRCLGRLGRPLEGDGKGTERMERRE